MHCPPFVASGASCRDPRHRPEAGDHPIARLPPSDRLFDLIMASTSFRDSMNSMGWSRRDPDVPANTASTPFLSTLQSWNPFSNEGFVRLPTHSSEAPGAPLPAASRREEEEAFFARKSPHPSHPPDYWRSACDKDRVPAQPLSSHA